MKLHAAILFALAFAACGTPPQPVTIKISSEPMGARVFFGAAPNEQGADRNKQFVGVTPCEYAPPTQEDGEFVTEGAFVYSAAVPTAFVFTAEPPTGSTNLFSKRQVFHGGTLLTPPARVPHALFFDLTKPDKKPEPKPEKKRD